MNDFEYIPDHVGIIRMANTQKKAKASHTYISWAKRINKIKKKKVIWNALDFFFAF